MKVVTQKFLDAQKNTAPAMVRQVFFKRRFWVESSKSYVWETNWTALPESKVVDVSDITWQLDIQSLNEFKTSNVTLTLENMKNQWNGANPYGNFAKDAASPLYGYEPYWTKFQVRTGMQYPDKTTELVNVFTGVATEYTLDSATGAMQITLTGEEALLIAANAESVSTTVTNETATGAVDGSNKVFTTAHNGVGLVTEVSDNGLTKRAGADYTISQTNDQNNPGKVSFLVAPTSGHTIRVSYLYWKTSQKFEDLITALLNQAGVPGGNQFVSPVIFPSNIVNTHVWQTQADWQGGSSLTDIDTAFLPNSIKIDYATTDAYQLTTWGDSTAGWTMIDPPHMSIAMVGGYLQAQSTDFGGLGAIYRSLSSANGRWQNTLTLHSLSGDAAFEYRWFPLFNAIGSIGGGSAANDPVLYQGYAVYASFSGSGSTSLRLTRVDGPTKASEVTLASTSLTHDNSDHVLRFVRYPSGLLIVYVDGTQVLSATDNTYTTGSYTGFSYFKLFNVAKSGALYTPATSLTGTWISGAVDFGATPNAWTQFQWTQTLNGGAVTYYTATSADNITYDAYVAVPSNGAIGSTLRRYVKVKTVLLSTLAGNQDPSVANITVGSITSSTVITLANFTGMTCYDAITDIAKFANYEFGFDGSENFYFRAKNPGRTPVFTLGATDFAMHISSMVNGYDRVFSKIRASYAGYIKDISDDGMMWQDPQPRFGYSMQQIDGGSILVSADADVATGLAGSFFNYYRLPRRRITVQTKILPQLDISDVVSASFQDLFPSGRWYIGDTSTYLGDPTKSLYGPEEQILPPLLMKVEGIRINTNDWTTDFDLEEVL